MSCMALLFRSTTTDMRDNPLVSFVLATYNRPDDLTDAIESIHKQTYRPIEIIVISNSTDETQELFKDLGEFDREWIHYYEFPGRMGVPEARNMGYERASGEILVTIDDDAVLANADATDEIVRLFQEHTDVGTLAFQSRNHQTDELIRMEIPDPPDFETPASKAYRTTTFIGVGNAIRRSALDAAGNYPDKFVYGFEEMDLSIRLLDAGYDILYAPSIVVYHKESPAARRPSIEEQERQIENRIRLAVRNLPWRYVVGTALVWLSYWSLRSRLNMSSLRRILRRLYEDHYSLLAGRSVVGDETIALLKARSSMLYGWWIGPHPRRILGSEGDLRRLSW